MEKWIVIPGEGISLRSPKIEMVKIASGRDDKPNEAVGMKTINLFFAVHNHQPLGNFDRVFDRERKSVCPSPSLAQEFKLGRFCGKSAAGRRLHVRAA